ncbi:hypothetical protein WMY93_020866 [Mugilogobius chulae]|uniref:WH1 domain-containing protein n=1 Tax=Mugilogobius chulae TaxID=88201 RepID=A0AAW0NLE0_9GOBI
MSDLLTMREKIKVHSLIDPHCTSVSLPADQVHSGPGAAGLKEAEGRLSWRSSACGVLCLSKTTPAGTYFLRLFCVRAELLWEHEVYVPFKYIGVTHEHQIGFNFADETEAEEFHFAVEAVKEDQVGERDELVNWVLSHGCLTEDDLRSLSVSDIVDHIISQFGGAQAVYKELDRGNVHGSRSMTLPRSAGSALSHPRTPAFPERNSVRVKKSTSFNVPVEREKDAEKRQQKQVQTHYLETCVEGARTGTGARTGRTTTSARASAGRGGCSQWEKQHELSPWFIHWTSLLLWRRTASPHPPPLLLLCVSPRPRKRDDEGLLRPGEPPEPSRYVHAVPRCSLALFCAGFVQGRAACFASSWRLVDGVKQAVSHSTHRAVKKQHAADEREKGFGLRAVWDICCSK